MSIDPEHEKAYSPSAWSKRFPGLQMLSKFLQLAQQVTVNARKTIPCKLDISYGRTERMKYDVYGINLPNDAPVLIFIHGGYWQECSKEFAGFHVPVLVSKGIKVFNIGYDLCPTVTLTEIVAEIRIAVEEILKISQKVGCNRLWIAGHSAGAHLAASLLYDYEWQALMTQQNRFQLIKGFILIGGIYSLEPLLTTSYNEALKLTEKEVKTLSFNTLDESQIKTISNIKAIVAVGECDAPKFIDESRNYAKKLLEFLDRVEYLLLRDNVDHFDIVENFMNPNFILIKAIIDNVIGNS